jgi:hypothetical protein
MNLAVAATSISPTAMIAIDGQDLALIQETFFDQNLMQSVRSQMAFAAAPGGNA